MAKKLIQYDQKYYKLNNEALRKLISEKSDVGPEAKIREIIAAEDMGEMLQTIKNWYYGNGGTQDIESLKKIAHFFNVPVTKILIETDQTWEYIEEAKSKPGERTYEAAKEVIRRGFIESPSDDPDYSEANGFAKYKERLPKGLPKLLLFYTVCIWTCTLDFYIFCRIAPVMLFFCIEYTNFLFDSYFDKRSVKIWKIIGYLIEALVLIGMVYDIIKYYI